MKESENVTVSLWAYKNNYRWEKDSPEFHIMPLCSADDKAPIEGAFLVGRHQLEVPLSWPEDTTTAQVDSLKEEQQRASTLYHKRHNELEEMIRELLALPAPESE